MIEPLPDDQSKKLPPLPDEAFDGDKESVKLEFKKCNHDFYLRSSRELRCKHCTICLEGDSVHLLLQTSKRK